MERNGFSLLQLLVTLAVAGTLLGLAVPSFRAFLLDSRMTADVNAFVLAVQVARSEVAKRGRTVVVCRTLDRQRCDGAALDLAAGFMVFINEDDDYPPARGRAEPLLYAHERELTGRISANRPFFEFRPRPRRSTNGTVVFCDERGAGAARAVIVSYTGRPRIGRRTADGKPLICASFP
jgi:type IV fimbrial biogenesis protein FimT